ncbi:hypothetical protein L1987_10126 [Smallanthus sonchifolius]|uniref:Uncharacterized protein n=1 Tax=Smallanthus sonchifolius TaxID=185202 RepID=A0ACB9JRD1_9ASTR|nr:hypothetical protein L1987_10126 [Smallanthus sonchifolius]
MEDTLVFAVNGDRIELSSVDPSTTLLHVNGCSITTTEGLGNMKDGFHSIHQRFAGFHASQCGFCTPGMCVSLFSALVNSDKTHRTEPAFGSSKLTVLEAEKSISGNLCRCTGYRPIADVFKSFAADVDMEDLGINSFWNKETKLHKLPFYDSKQISTYPEFLRNERESTTVLNYQNKCWYSPLSVEELGSLLESISAENGMMVKLVAGNTGTRYYKETEYYNKYIDLRFIPELSTIKKAGSQIEIGATVSISKLILALKEERNDDLISEGDIVFKKIASHLEKIASEAIRNVASIGGNLVMAQRKNFPSDIATVLLAVKSKVTILTGVNKEILTLEGFLEKPALNSRNVLLSVFIPCLKPTKNDCSENIKTKLLFETYRASPRPLGNALAYLNAALLAEICHVDNGVVINCIQLAFGSFGAKHAIRAGTVENYLVGKKLSVDLIYEAVKLLRVAISPENGTSHPAYRSSLAVSFLFDFLLPIVDADDFIHKSTCNNPGIGSGLTIDDCERTALLSSAKQVIESSHEHYPVGQPIIKSGAAIQASGEAVFVDDIPSPLNCLRGAFIYSIKPLARVKNIKLKSEKDVNSVVTFHDIPKGGENVGAINRFGQEPLFSNELTQCAGQRIAFVVAETQKNADMAADTAMVDYYIEDLEPPILTVEQAVEKSSFFEVPSFLYPSQVGDFSKGMAESDHQIHCEEIKLPSQYYFYMETQTALAVPDEDNCMVVYSSSQVPEFAHVVISRCLNIPEHNVRVITRRVGGGFGGKSIKAMPVATACALAAYKLRRPVRTYVNRKTDMIMAGGRHPMKINYTVGFKSNGKITALHLDILINAGMSPDVSPIIPWNMIGSFKKYNFGAFSFDFKLCKTNHSSKSAMRAPGEVQGSFIAEVVIEHIATYLSLDVGFVREMNFHNFDSLKLFYGNSAGEPLEYTLPTIWDKLMKSSNFDHRDGSVVVEVGGIELGQGLWTKVRVIQADTLSMVQGGFTAGSTTSEASCEAVRLCCNVLVERLVSLKEKIEGAFVQGIGFFMLEEYLTNSDGLVVADGTWTYKIPTIDTIPKQPNVQILNSGHHKNRVLSSKASGEPPLLLAASVHCATRAAIKEARNQLYSWKGLNGSDSFFQLDVPATMPVVKTLCGLDNVEFYLQSLLSS